MRRDAANERLQKINPAALWGEASEMGCRLLQITHSDVRFSNRPFGVKHFQTIHHCSVDVARGLVLLFGIGTRALVWGFLCQGVCQGGESLSFVGFFVRSQSPFLRPDPRIATSTRAESVKVGRRTNLAACSALARPYLDSFEQDGPLMRSG